MQWWPGGRTEQKAFLNSLFCTPSIAATIEPAASNVAFLLPGEIIVSPSKEEKPFIGNELFTKSRYLASWASLIISSVIFILFFEKIKVPAALLTGTLVASGLLQIIEVASYQISPDVIDYCLLILGSSVGCRFADKTFGEIGRNALHSFVATFLLVILGVAAAFAAGLIIDKNFFTLLLSYCPGGIYEVAVIAIFFDLDPEFVSFHHIIRLLMILFAVPVILKIISKKA